jgi:hypothetical protein
VRQEAIEKVKKKMARLERISALLNRSVDE